MTEQTTYTGDILIALNDNGDYDLNYRNGQPDMTDGFDTAVMLAVFGLPDFWQNDITNDPNGKYDSEFPNVIKNGSVDNKTIKNGNAALKKALKFMINIGAAQSVDVSGGVINIFGLYWTIEIVKGNITSKYIINWDKGVIAVSKAV